MIVQSEDFKKRKSLIFYLLIFFFLLCPLHSENYENIEIVSVEKTKEIEAKLKEANLDLLMEGNNRIYIVASWEELLILENENIPYTLETANFYPCFPSEISFQGGINGKYHSYRELEAEMMALEKAHPQLARVFDIGDSLEGRNIYALKISDSVGLDEEEAEVVFIGCHHAREWISVEIPFLLGKFLVENYELNPEIKDLVDRSEIWIVPLLNPDGLEYSIHVYRYWRKNRRANADGSFGVDLNRNYGYMWGYDNKGSSPNSYSAVYRGLSPFSEPETQAIRDLFLKKNFKAMITYHSYSQLIMYPWGYTETRPAEAPLLEEIAAKMSELIHSVNGNLYNYGQAGATLYLTNGDTADWAFGTYGIPCCTIELPPLDVFSGGFFNQEEEIQSIFEENLPAMLYLITRSAQISEPGNTSVDRKRAPVGSKRMLRPSQKY